jgi:hypothetical protein
MRASPLSYLHPVTLNVLSFKHPNKMLFNPSLSIFEHHWMLNFYKFGNFSGISSIHFELMNKHSSKLSEINFGASVKDSKNDYKEVALS